MLPLEDLTKENLFKENGYNRIHKSLCYVNHSAGKIFTRGYIDDNEPDILRKNIYEPHESNGWKIYCNSDQKHTIDNILLEVADRPNPCR